MTSFTPGPWAALPVVSPLADGTFLISSPDEAPTKAFVCKVRDGPNVAANARLIAAAPDLLAALKVCKEALQYHVQYDDGEILEIMSREKIWRYILMVVNSMEAEIMGGNNMAGCLGSHRRYRPWRAPMRPPSLLAGSDWKYS